MINPTHLKELVIEPVLLQLDKHSESATNLILGTAIVESNCGLFLKQLEGGPARGIYQMEPKTHEDIWVNYLNVNHDIIQKVKFYCLNVSMNDYDLLFTLLPGNLYYATAMCRLHYSRFKEPLPESDDIEGLAYYWKKYYNTEDGAGTAQKFIDNWEFAFD